MRQIHTFFIFSKVIQHFVWLFTCTCVTPTKHVFCKSCEHEIVFVLIFPLAEQYHVHRPYKTCESTMSYIGNFEENIDLSHIHLAVLWILETHKLFGRLFCINFLKKVWLSSLVQEVPAIQYFLIISSSVHCDQTEHLFLKYL